MRSTVSYLLVTTRGQMAGKQDSQLTGNFSHRYLVARTSSTDLRKAEAGTLGTNLIIHYGVADIFSQTTKFIRILGAVQELRDLAPLFQWDEVLKNIIQIPRKLWTSDWVLTLERLGYRLRISLLSSSLTSPSGTGPLSDSASRATRDINDSIVWRHATVC